MKLLKEVITLRKEFTNIKIRQFSDEYNRKCAAFILPDCEEQIKLTFEHDCIILEFYGSLTIYGYQKREFDYLIAELYNLINCNTLVIRVSSGNVVCGSMIVSEKTLNESFIQSTANRMCHNKFSNGNQPQSVFAELHYCNSVLDRTEYCKIS